jgi:hypothetical protein
MKTVDLQLSSLLEDLGNGLTWLKKEDVGYGSIQEKYNTSDVQIKIIRKHPKLQNVEPTIVVFNIIDDTEQEPAPAKKVTKKVDDVISEPVPVVKTAVSVIEPSLESDMSAFANL